LEDRLNASPARVGYESIEKSRPLPQPEFSDDEYESESSKDPDFFKELIPCDTLYATLLASGEAKEPYGYGTL